MSGTKKVLAVSTIILVVGIIAYLMSPSVSRRKENMVADRPNILLITLDTTRADHLSCYGYGRNTTPNVDQVAQESHIFRHAVSTSSWTLPAHASLFTGTYPSRHGARFAPKESTANSPLHVNCLDDKLPTLAEVLLENGYVTAGIGGGPWFHQKFGLGRGFSFYRDPAIENGAQWMSRTAEEVNEIALAWLQKNHHRPFFLFINYFDPHTPYSAPHPFSTWFGQPPGVTDAFEVTDKLMRDGEKLSDMEFQSLLLAYDNEIAYADFYLGKLLDEMKKVGVYYNTIIIITSDHGEYFGEHDLLTHSVMVYEEVVRIPLIIRFPHGIDEKAPVDEYVQLTDIMPTILSELDIPIPAEVQGQVIGKRIRPVVAESFQHFDYTERYGSRFDNDWRAFYRDNYKYIWSLNDEPQLFDLSIDPQETDNLALALPEKLDEFRNEMATWLTSFSPYPFARYREFEPNLKKEELESLKALGYIQ